MPLEFEFASAEESLLSSDTPIVEIIDGLLGHGVVLRGELSLTVADVDLVFLGLDLLLTTPEKMHQRNAAI